MKKVYQTIVKKGHGNCMQAVIASLLELNLEEVPNFIEYGDKWYNVFDKFINEYGYCPNYIVGGIDCLQNVANFDNGVNGYFFGSVNSQTFEGIMHAVIVDKFMNIVHDPNPNERALKLSSNDVKGIYTMHPIIIDTDGKCYTPEHYDLLKSNTKNNK